MQVGHGRLETFALARHQESQGRSKAAPAVRLVHDLRQIIIVNYLLRRSVFLVQTTRNIA